jgi:hypothetical protein
MLLIPEHLRRTVGSQTGILFLIKCTLLGWVPDEIVTCQGAHSVIICAAT